MVSKDNIAWIIGASSGIGKSLAIELSMRGVKLVISARNTKELEKVRENCLRNTDHCSVIPLDLEQNNDYSKEVSEVVSLYGGIDYLFLVGGISQRSMAIETPDTIDRKLMEINYFGNISITKAVLPIMIKKKSGHIIVVSSIAGKFGWKLRSAYSASKHALHGFFESLRAEQKINNINITIVVPGRVQTKISYNALLKDGSKHGKMDSGQQEGISANLCSKQIIKAINKNQKEVLIGGKEIFMVWIRKFLPFIFYRFAAKTEPK